MNSKDRERIGEARHEWESQQPRPRSASTEQLRRQADRDVANRLDGTEERRRLCWRCHLEIPAADRSDVCDGCGHVAFDLDGGICRRCEPRDPDPDDIFWLPLPDDRKEL